MPSPSPSPAAQAHTPIGGARALIALGVIGAIFVAALLSWGQGGAWGERLAGFLSTLANSAWAPLLYMLGALGLGKIARPLLRHAPERRVSGLCIELGVGLTITLSLTHLLGICAMLNQFTAWGISGIGLALLIPDLKRVQAWDATSLTLSPGAIVVVCAGLLALVMACNPPGMLWGSEYGGFDALSYHLQLPHEWIEQGRIWPSEHNVYSFLPSYIESAYAHVALLMGGTMHTHDARGAMSAQLLSVMMLLGSAGVIAALTREGIQRFVPGADAGQGSLLAMALTLGTPWLLIVGTLAYNEIAVVLLGACAMLVAIRTDLACWKRAIMCALIVGGACSCKPTALFLLAPSVGIVLLACSPKKQWVMVTFLCCIVGALTIAPWLIRNELATGNLVFPQMNGIFSDGHWNESQHEIYAQAHQFEGSLLDRFTLLILPDPDGMDHVSRFRGLSNAQWGLTPLLGLAGLFSLLVMRSTRRVGLVCAGAIALPIVAWALFTHIQSRFLIPLAPMLIVLGSAAIARVPTDSLRRGTGSLIAMGSLVWCIGIALAQGRSSPLLLIDLGPGVFMREMPVGTPPWTATLNQLSNEGDTVYLLGDATPFYATGDVRYNTVYDRWLIQDAIESHPDDPGRWTETLASNGIDLVVVSFSEIDRYAQSGWLPDEIDIDRLIVWIDSLGQPIEVWSDPGTGAPIRAIFRVSEQSP